MTYQDGSIKDGNFKNGRMSYAELITEALNNAPRGELVISDIFKSINLRHPQYKLEDMRWQNSVSGAISRNKNFAKGNKANKYQRYWKFSEADSILASKVVNELKLKKSNNTKNGNLKKMKRDNSNSESDEEPSGYEKPSMSYAQLIAEAINNAPKKTLVLSDIYKTINAKHPYYKLESKGWQNSIRHNLTLNKNFIKEERFGQVGCWKLSKDVPKSLLETKQKYFAISGKIAVDKLSEDHSFFAPKDVKRVYMCSHCDKDFSSIGGLNNHYYAVHEGKFQKNGNSDGALSDKNMSDNTNYNNPWSVENIQAFSYLNCPECTFKVKEENLFQDHAVKNHSMSSVLFGANITTECVYIKTEPNEDFTEYDMVEKELNQNITLD
jgi:DNA-directed RNA polymerase subunit RPC12/RpoP